jgi:hypothetical protein
MLHTGLRCQSETNELASDEVSPNHEELVLWVLKQVNDSTSRQSLKSIESRLSMLELSLDDFLICLRSLAASQSTVAAVDRAVDVFLKRFGEILVERTAGKNFTDLSIRKDICEMVVDVLRDVVASRSEGWDQRIGMYLSPRALLKLIRLGRSMLSTNIFDGFSIVAIAPTILISLL